MGRYRNSSAILFSVFFAVLTIPAGIFAEGSKNTINNESFVSNGGISGNASILSLSPSVSELAITSGPQISTIDPVRTKVRLMNSFGSSWAGGLTDVFDSYNITYTIKLQYCYAFAFGVCIWWADFSPVKEKTYSNIVYVIKALTSAKLVVSKPDSYQVDYTYDPLNTQSTEAAENWAENLMNSLDGVVVGYLGTQDSGKTLALTVTVRGYAENNGKSVSDYNWNIMANSANNPFVVTVTNPPDPDIKYSGSRQYRLDGAWYSFSTPIKIKNGQSKNVDFYATNIGSGPSSNEGYVSISISNNLDISDSGSGYWSASYPPGSQLGGKCQVPSSTYKLLDTWAKYNASQSRYIYTKLTGKSLGDGWIKVRASFDTPANGLNSVNDPRTGETNEQDQQCFPAYKIPVIVGECFAGSDCGSDGYIGSSVCSNDDVLQTFRHYACNTNYTCEYTESNNVIQDCGDDYCDAWQNAYCEGGNQLWHNRECYDRGCSDSACFNKKFTQAQKIQDCPGQTEPWSDPYCASGQVLHSRGLYDGWCAGLTPARCDYKLRTNEVEVVDGCADYCGSWSVNYCKGENVYRNRTCHDKGCNTGDIKCYDNVNIQEEMVINCGSSGYGPGYCYDNDIYRDYQTNGCSAGSCYSSSQTEKMAECGSDSCDTWGSNYCKDDDVYHKRTCHSRGCSANSCFDNTYADEQKVQDCPSWMTCSNGQCVAICTDECSAGQTRCSENYRQSCGNYDADSCLEWDSGFDCGTGYCENWSANYCKSGDVYQNRTCYSRGCSSGACLDNRSTEEQLVEMCPEGCANGECINKTIIRCNSDSDCGESHWSGTPYCGSKNSVFDSWVRYVCSGAGIINSSCSNQSRYTVKENCNISTYCSSGYCQSCSSGTANCNENFLDGCETNLLIDGNNCGFCGNACGLGLVCKDGKCAEKLQGDVDGNCKVDILDLAAVGLAYGSKPGDSNWSINADFNKNNVVDIFDLTVVGLNYGRSC